MAGKISYVKNEDPAFIKAFKQKAGYKEQPTLVAKSEKLAFEEDDRSDNEDEKPVVVVLKQGDISAEEIEQLKDQGKIKDQDDGTKSSGKITFNKPKKRLPEESTEIITTTSSKKKKEQKTNTDRKKNSSSKDVKNLNLLSFGDKDYDDESS